MQPNRPIRPGLTAAAVVLALAACGPATASPTLSLQPSTTATAPAPTSPAASPSATPSSQASPIASATPASSPGVTADGWRRVPDQPSLQAAQLGQVVWTGTRFVASGSAMDGGAVFLDSPDGLTWHLQPELGATASVRGLATGPNGVIAVGADGPSARSWTSLDGLHWTAAPAASALDPKGDDNLVMSAAVPIDTGWLAVGTEEGRCVDVCEASVVKAVVWTSTDGRHWARQPDATSFAHASMAGVVRGGPGFVAVGLAPDHPGSQADPGLHGVVWTSTDDRRWSRVADAAVFHAPSGTDQQFGASMMSVAAGGDRIVAVGTVGSQGDVGSALAWWSSDGRTWVRGTGDRFPYGQMFHVTAVPGGIPRDRALGLGQLPGRNVVIGRRIVLDVRSRRSRVRWLRRLCRGVLAHARGPGRPRRYARQPGIGGLGPRRPLIGATRRSTPPTG